MRIKRTKKGTYKKENGTEWWEWAFILFAYGSLSFICTCKLCGVL